MKKWLVFTLLLLFFVTPGQAHAQMADSLSIGVARVYGDPIRHLDLILQQGQYLYCYGFMGGCLDHRDFNIVSDVETNDRHKSESPTKHHR